MSSTNRGADRNKDDFYRTPHWCVDRLIDRVEFADDADVVEPCAGCGDIVIPARQCYPDWVWSMFEKREEEKAVLLSLAEDGDDVRIGDSVDGLELYGEQWDLLLGNPPFSLARRFIETYTPRVTRSFWLLRLNFLGSKARRDWLAEMRPNLYVLPDRACFGYNKDGKLGTDSIEYAWFEFGAHTTGRWELLDLTPKEEIKADLEYRFGKRKEQLSLL